MIDPIQYVIGFLVYVGFCIATFDTYAQKDEPTNIPALIFIYIFYTLLAVYFINVLDMNGSSFDRTIESLFYAVVGGIVMVLHYQTSIKQWDRERYSDAGEI